MTTESFKEMNDFKHRSVFKEALTIHKHYNFICRSRSQAIAMPMIFSLTQHDFLPVFSILRKHYAHAAEQVPFQYFDTPF